MKTNVRRRLSAVTTNRTHSIALSIAGLAVTGVVAGATSGAAAAPETTAIAAVAEQGVSGDDLTGKSVAKLDL